ncbi:MAG: hypothetical protein ACOC3V_05165, partial [bacterium]
NLHNINSYDWNKLKGEELLGEIDDPVYGKRNMTSSTDISLSFVSHKIYKLNLRPDGLYGDIKTINTIYGLLLEELIKSGIKFVFRVKGYGQIGMPTKMEKMSGFNALTINNDVYDEKIFRREKINNILKNIEK